VRLSSVAIRRPWGGGISDTAGYTQCVSRRDPYDVLGVEPGAPPPKVKAAWRRLARQHHPDLIGDDPEASRVATRQMAEINEAYAAISRGGVTRQGERGRAGGASFDEEPAGRRRGGPPRPKPTRPVTGRLDTSETVRPRNAPFRTHGADGRSGAATTLRGQAPLRFATQHREPPRASDPTGPLERGRIRDFRRPPPPPLDDAVVRELEFGRFRGHTLGEVAAFEPSYIDWLARTITRDPELVAAARVVQEDLDRRGIARRDRVSARPTPGTPSGRSA
jgi:DnaJ domain